MSETRAGQPDTHEGMLQIRDLRTEFATAGDPVTIVDGVSLSVKPGRTLCIVGESGCGKSMLSLSLMRLVPPPGSVVGGEVTFFGEDLLDLDDEAMRSIRGRRIAMIFQEPMTSLNPVFTIGDQIVEAMRSHDRSVSRKDLRRRALEALVQVEMTDPARRMKQYPHELSGGMRQRAMIAMALVMRPELLIADEPTTALDVSVQAQILDLLKRLQRETGMGVIFITHDLGVVSEIADEVAVMYAGRVVERAPVADLLSDPQHPYTIGLLASVPQLDGDATRLQAIDGMVPAPDKLPPGCRFHPRCVFATQACAATDPALRELAPGHYVACIRAPIEETE